MAQLMPLHSLSLALVKSRLDLLFWYQLTRVVQDKGPLNGCVCGYRDIFFVVTDDGRRWQFESITLHRNVLLPVLFGVAERYWLNLAVVSVGLWKLDTC